MRDVVLSLGYAALAFILGASVLHLLAQWHPWRVRRRAAWQQRRDEQRQHLARIREWAEQERFLDHVEQEAERFVEWRNR